MLLYSGLNDDLYSSGQGLGPNSTHVKVKNENEIINLKIKCLSGPNINYCVSHFVFPFGFHYVYNILRIKQPLYFTLGRRRRRRHLLVPLGYKTGITIIILYISAQIIYNIIIIITLIYCSCTY